MSVIIRAVHQKKIHNIITSMQLAILFRSSLVICLLFCLASCAPPRPVFNSAETTQLPEPNINIYLKPVGHLDMTTKRVLMGKMRPPSLNQADRPYLAMTRLVEDIFLQSRLFAELDIAADPNLSIERLIKLGVARRFDYIMLADSSIFYPSGNSRGWVGLDLKLVDTSDSFVIWHIYGELDLLPQSGGESGITSIFYQRPFKKAQDPAQGLAAIARSMADLMRESMTVPSPVKGHESAAPGTRPCPGD